jgi:predicted DNA-binding transcriptional regulator YafY
VVFPFGLYASGGYWYCACFDRKRDANVSMRADRFLTAERVEGYERPAHVPFEHWPHDTGNMEGERPRLRAYGTGRGMTSFELTSFFGRISPNRRGGGVVEADVPKQELDYYALHLLSVGTDVVVRSPPS